MPKNLVFFSDGTGNDGHLNGATNVYKLYQRLHNDIPGHHRLRPEAALAHLKAPNVWQVTSYDPGVGSSWRDFIGKATGMGISNNIKDGYDFLLRFYQPGDRIYLFGFSRGAYTVRSLAGLIGYCGVPGTVGGDRLLLDGEYRKRLVEEAYAIYRTEEGPQGASERKQLGAEFIRKYGPEEHTDPAARAVYMIGVWDTVRALGIPWRYGDIEVLRYNHRFHDHNLSEYVRYAFHALSVDDERQAFHPVIWNEPTTARKNGAPERQAFAQVLFPGVHADVGGGYEDDTGLSDQALKWMIGKVLSAEHPPVFYSPYDDDPVLGLNGNASGKLHDSLAALWRRTLYKRKARTVARGVQQRDSRLIAPDDDDPVPPLHRTWIDRHSDRDVSPHYDPGCTRDHPDTRIAREQSRGDDRPLPGPFSHIDEWEPPAR